MLPLLLLLGLAAGLSVQDGPLRKATTLLGSHGSEGMLLQNSWGNLTSGFDVAATVSALVATKQTLLGMFVDECAYYDTLVPMLPAFRCLLSR